MHDEHIKFMEMAVVEAEKAGQMDEVPIGAVVVNLSGKIVAQAHNQVITLADPTAHAEILALREASREIGNYRLLNTTLYVTVEPCPMCMGAILHARVARIVFGTFDPKWGAVGSLFNYAKDDRFNHRPEVITGICKETCKNLMQDFFRTKRK